MFEVRSLARMSQGKANAPHALLIRKTQSDSQSRLIEILPLLPSIYSGQLGGSRSPSLFLEILPLFFVFRMTKLVSLAGLEVMNRG